MCAREEPHSDLGRLGTDARFMHLKACHGLVHDFRRGVALMAEKHRTKLKNEERSSPKQTLRWVGQVKQ
jgi:hypothetical protein